MADLPTGTVSLLFSDIEGSTGLLARLGPAYADALDGQRRVLRKAWADHAGVELGTEGDSFYVVFATAPNAVAAAVQAQRELAEFSWPAGERVRVRIGIHTGNPTPHDGAYVGMDVHRAARVAGAAHGGQVLISEVTRNLISDCLPDGVALKDLGSHQLKDIPSPERLFQLTIPGLDSVFPPPKTLGAATSLPRPPTPLVGRDGELAELTALLGSPQVRLVTLTGPGGTGKTRLAIAVAQQLVERFPDGVYFVPLAAVTTADVMWTSIAEVLDVPPEGRIPPGFFDHVAHRSALFVLDNLEQIHGADTVVAELLHHAPQVVVIATSRRGLAVPAEHVHPVPPLELPDGSTTADAQSSGAVQLFVQQARKVKPSFALTADNAGDITEICVRLDGLPLAIELAAARTRLLTPKALLARLDTALDITAHGNQTPSRQKTLRDTIAWSYDLLTADQQRFFRHLGTFAGGADLDAIAAVTTNDEEPANRADPFDLVADLADASLLTITATPDGEPRIAMLETVRAYAREQLRKADEVDEAQRRHAEHYAGMVRRLYESRGGAEFLAATRQYQLEADNLREGLRWGLAKSRQQEHLLGPSLQFLHEFSFVACHVGFLTEARSWLERVSDTDLSKQQPEGVRCQATLAWILLTQGDHHRAHELFSHTLQQARAAVDTEALLASLNGLSQAAAYLGDNGAGRPMLEEAVRLSQAVGSHWWESGSVGNLFVLEHNSGDYERADELLGLLRQLDQAAGDEYGLAWGSVARVELLWRQNKSEQARKQLTVAIPDAQKMGDPAATLGVASAAATVLAPTEPTLAAQILGAIHAMREREGRPLPEWMQQEEEDDFAEARATLGEEYWAHYLQLGRQQTLANLLTAALDAVSVRL